MQDKEKNITNIDQQFEDHSWSEMRKMLDAKMPQPIFSGKGKKRYLLLLIILLVGFVSGIGTMMFVNLQHEIEFPVTEETKKDIAESSDPIETIDVDKYNGFNSSNNNSEKLINQNSVDLNSKKKRSIKNSIRTTNQKINEIVIAKKTALEKESNQISNNLETKQNELLSQNESQSFSENSNVETEPIQVMDWISSKPISLESFQLDYKMELVEIPSKKKLFFGITLGAYSNNVRKFAGISLGGKAAYDINRRFTLGAGLQYSILSGYKEASFSNADEVSALPTTDLDSLSNSTFEELIESYNSSTSRSGITNLPISSLHYIEIPLGITYRFSKQFQINLGVKAGYLAKSKVDKYLPSSNANLDTRSSLDDKKLYNSLNKFDLATTVGIGFYPVKNFGIDLQYNHGMIDFTKNDTWPKDQVNKNKNIQLSMVYFFGKK